MNKLIQLDNDRPVTTSRKVADYFGKAHRDVLRAIKNLESPYEFNLLNFQQIAFTDDKGREYPEYLITRDGFMILCMGFLGKKAMEVKLTFLNAFNEMERQLAKQNDKLEWKQARLQTKDARKSLTDIIKQFVDYATAQGSKNASMYYTNITKMEYAALELIEKGSKVGKNFRDTLDVMELYALTMAEAIARRELRDGMEQGLHYKEIYMVAKNAVEKYAEVAQVPRLK